MHTSNLPKNFVVLFSIFLLGSSLTSSCTTGRSTPAFHKDTKTPPRSLVININKANRADLEKLPHVGPVLAGKIVEYRDRNGPFRKTEHLLLVDGISEARFQEISEFINTE